MICLLVIWFFKTNEQRFYPIIFAYIVGTFIYCWWGVFFLRYMSLSGNQLPLHFVLRRGSSVIIFSFLKITEPLVTIFCSFFRIRASLSCTFYKLTIPMAVYAKQVMLKKKHYSITCIIIKCMVIKESMKPCIKL